MVIIKVIEEIHQSVAAIRGRSFYGRTRGLNGAEFGKFRVKVLERYSPSEQTDTQFLQGELQRLRKEIQELVKFFDKRFKRRQTKDTLIKKLMEKEQMKNDLRERGQIFTQYIKKFEYFRSLLSMSSSNRF